MSAMPGGLVLQPQFGLMAGQPVAMTGMMPAGLLGLGAMAQQQHLMEAAAAASAADRVSPTSASSASPALASAASANINADPADDERTAEYLRELQAEKETLEAKRSDEEDTKTKHAIKLLEQGTVFCASLLPILSQEPIRVMDAIALMRRLHLDNRGRASYILKMAQLITYLLNITRIAFPFWTNDN